MNSLRKTPGTAESRLKRRASLFAVSLKKMDNSMKDTTDLLSDNLTETLSSHDINELKSNKNPHSSKDFDKQEKSECLLKDDNIESYVSRQDKGVALHESREFNGTNADTFDNENSSLTRKDVNSRDASHSVCSEKEMPVDEIKVLKVSRLSNDNDDETLLQLVDLAPSTEDHSPKKPCLSPNSKAIEKKSRVEISHSTNVEASEFTKIDKKLIQEKKKVNEVTIIAKGTHDRCSISDDEKIHKEENQRKRKATENVELPDTKKIRVTTVEECNDMEDEEESLSGEGPDETFEEVKVKSSSSKSRYSYY